MKTMPDNYAASDIALLDLRVCGLINPLGLDEERPVFRFIPSSSARGRSITAYRLLVAEDEAALDKASACIWDSGKIISDDVVQIVYEGPALRPKTRYHWKAMVWDESGAPSDWSEAAWFETGFMGTEWAASWIGRNQPADSPENQDAAPYFRKVFTVDGPVQSARIYISGLGFFSLSINGMPVSDQLLTPAHSNYDQRVYYLVYDALPLLRKGENVVGIELGKGFFDFKEAVDAGWHQADWRSPPKLIFQLELQMQDGGTTILSSDESWKMTYHTPRRYDNLFWGEVYDARLEQPGWDADPHFDDSLWEGAPLAVPPRGQLSAQQMPPVRVTDRHVPAFVRSTDEGVYLFASDVMTAGNVRLTASAPAGTEIRLHYGETIDARGRVRPFTLSTDDIDRGPCQVDRYIFSGNGEESFAPKFSYKGFQYIEVESPVPLDISRIEILTIHNDVAGVSTFETSNPLLGQIYNAARRTFLNNYHTKPTDCPTYEKQGWLGDTQIALGSSLFLFDLETFYTKWVRDIVDCMLPDGHIPIIAPTYRRGLEHAVVWTTALVDTIWQLYQFTDNTRLMTEQFDSLSRYVEYEYAFYAAHDWKGAENELGDWCSPGHGCDNAPEKSAIVTTCYAFYLFETAAKIAETLGKKTEMQRWSTAAAAVRQTFGQTYYQPDKGCYETGLENGEYRQTSNALPLVFGLVEEKEIPKVVRRLREDVEARGFHIDTGIIGTRTIYLALSQYGLQDHAYRLAAQDTYPSQGYWIRQGATSMWESWEDGARSRNHYFLGTVVEWMYRVLGGLTDIEQGYRRVTIAPKLPGDLQHIKCVVQTSRGEIESEITKDECQIVLDVSVPVGTVAKVIIPKIGQESTLWEGGQLLPSRNGQTAARRLPPGFRHCEDMSDAFCCIVGSGRYRWVVSNQERH